ncbi:MAG: cytochrome c oxidase subunit 3 [Bacteroidota bacterium]|nr:cytochrome c oxidase subunit 3 [Bacteroidota bacterium]
MSTHSAKPAAGALWGGGRVPLGATYGKLMMWFFLLSDAFSFSALLVSYGYFRGTAAPGWVNPEQVFVGIPWIIHHGLPLVFVGIMTFILIFSSVTMVLAVEAGHRMDQKSVVRYMILTVIGGAMFLGCQAMEWSHLIHEGLTLQHNPFPVDGIHGNEPATEMFGQLFFIITGFHGFHVFSGVVINILITSMAANGVFQRRGHYEMVEKVGLYWHFIDLVWVFVFTLFYLV